MINPFGAATTTAVATTSPGMSSTLFSHEGAVIFTSSMYILLMIIICIVIWVNVFGCNISCGDSDDVYSDDSACGSCRETLQRSCAVLLVKYWCLRLYSCCCGCNPNFAPYMEGKINELNMRLEEGYESNEDMMTTQLNQMSLDNASGNVDFLHPDNIGEGVVIKNTKKD